MATIGNSKDLIISNGTSQYNIKDEFRLHLVGQDHPFGGTPKRRESVAYAERDGVEVMDALGTGTSQSPVPREAFEYKLEFVYFDNVNYSFDTMMKDFESFLLQNPSPTGIQIYNYYDNSLILGHLKDLSIKSYERGHKRGVKDYQEIVATFFVPKPNLCNFSRL